MGWGKVVLYAVGGISGVIFLYHFYQANYNLHRTEILLLERYRKLPFYWPPGPSQAHKNAAIDEQGLPPELVSAFSEWFLVTDLQEAGGVVRDDIIELFKELGLNEDHPAAKEFIQRGDGTLDEHRRMTGAGLQESITLMAKVSRPQGQETGTELGEEAVSLLRKKLRRSSASVLDGASALRAMQAPPVPAVSPAVAEPQAEEVQDEEADDGPGDEDEHRRFESARLKRIEEELMARLQRLGALSPGEEARLEDVRKQITRL